MKEILCEDIEVLQGTEIYPKLKKLSSDYKPRAFIYSVFIAVLFAIMAVMLYLFQEQGGLGCCIFDWLIGGVFFPLMIVLSAMAIMIVWGAIKILISKNPNIAKKIFLTENTKEALTATVPNDLMRLFFHVFFDLWDRSFGRLREDLESERFMLRLYSKGAVIAKTPAKIIPITSLYKAPGLGGKDTKALIVELIEEGDHAVFIGYNIVQMIDPKTEKTMNKIKAYAEAIAIVEKKYERDILRVFNDVCPGAIEKNENKG